jgi:hypothetical protein
MFNGRSVGAESENLFSIFHNSLSQNQKRDPLDYRCNSRMSPSPTLCQVCSEEASKYKCPKCRIRYCSVPCFKGHVCLPSTDVIPSNEISPTNKSLEQEAKEPEKEIPEEEQLQPGHIAALLSSAQIQQSLSSPRLAQVLQHIDSAKTQDEALKRLRESQEGNPDFDSFTNQVLDILDASRESPAK